MNSEEAKENALLLHVRTVIKLIGDVIWQN